MPIYSSVAITDSVGRNGRNRHLDVVTIQQRLNDLMHAPRVPLDVDGKSGPKTRAMIRDFQRSVCKFKWPDGRVDPAAKTIQKLNDPQSESEWANMSIPPEPSGGGGNGGGGGGGKPDTPKKQFDAVEAAIESIEASKPMTAAEKAAMKVILMDVWKAKKGGYNGIGPTGMTEQDLDDWLDVAKDVFDFSRITIVATSGSIAALGSAAVVLSALGVVFMTAGLVAALGRALTSHRRVYGAIGAAYYITYWVHGGLKPLGSDRTLENYEEFTGKKPDYQEMYMAWHKSQAEAKKGLHEAVRDMASRTGWSYLKTKEIMKLVLKTAGKNELTRHSLKKMADGFYEDGDVQVANALKSIAVSAEYAK